MKQVFFILLLALSVFAINPKTTFQAIIVKDSIIDSGLVAGGVVVNASHKLISGQPLTLKSGTGITITKPYTDTAIISLYAPPVITSLINTSPVNYVGQTVTAVTVNWTLGGNAITSQTLTDASIALSDRTHAFTGLTLTADKTYTLSVTDGTTPSNASTTVYFYIQNFTGTTANAAPTSSDLHTGSTNWLTQYASNRALGNTSITGGGNYVYYAYPSAWGNVQIYVNGFSTTWNKTTVSVTNSFGNTQNYYVYTSPTTIVGSITLSATGI